MNKAIAITLGVVTFVGVGWGLKALRVARAKKRTAKAEAARIDANLEGILGGLEAALEKSEERRRRRNAPALRPEDLN